MPYREKMIMAQVKVCLKYFSKAYNVPISIYLGGNTERKKRNTDQIKTLVEKLRKTKTPSSSVDERQCKLYQKILVSLSS